jgi:nitrogen fixation protein FixH
VTVTDNAGQPVTGAAVEARGDMTHAGMAPVLVSAEETGPGIYVAQMDWNMGGDWILTVTATAPDGRTGSARLETRVES